MVTGHRKENYVVEIGAGEHEIVSDVSAKLGGTDVGPDPHEILEASLAACTMITVQMYANRKGWPLVSTNVKVTIDKEGSESHISRAVSFTGDLSAEQRASLLEIANKCPIHRFLKSQIEITTTVQDLEMEK